MKWWDIRQDIRDFRWGNLTRELSHNSRMGRLLGLALAVLKVIQAIIIYLGWARYGVRYPAIDGALAKTPLEILDIQPGELVQITQRRDRSNTRQNKS